MRAEVFSAHVSFHLSSCFCWVHPSPFRGSPQWITSILLSVYWVIWGFPHFFLRGISIFSILYSMSMLCLASTFLFPFHTILTTKLALSQVSWWNHNWQRWCLTSSPSRKRSHGTATNSSIAVMRPRKGGKPSMASGHLVQRDKHVPQLKWNPPFTYLL